MAIGMGVWEEREWVAWLGKVGREMRNEKENK